VRWLRVGFSFGCVLLVACGVTPTPSADGTPGATTDAGPVLQVLGGSYPLDGCRHGLDDACASMIYGQAAASFQDTADLLSQAATLGPHPDGAQVQALIDGFVDIGVLNRVQNTMAVFPWVELVVSTPSQATPDSALQQNLSVLDAYANHCGAALSGAGLYIYDAAQGTPISSGLVVSAGNACVDLLANPALFRDRGGRYTPYLALVPWVRGVAVRLLVELAVDEPAQAGADLRSAFVDARTQVEQLRALGEARCAASPSSPACEIVGRREAQILAPALDRVIAALDAEAAVLIGP
jgi:hypothetical protein